MITKTDFTENQIKLLELLSTGHEDTEIAENLNISHHTVRNWISKLFVAFAVKTRAHLAAQAIRENIIK